MSRQEVAFLEKAREIGGCGSLKRIFMPDLYQNFRILGCDMAKERDNLVRSRGDVNLVGFLAIV